MITPDPKDGPAWTRQTLQAKIDELSAYARRLKKKDPQQEALALQLAVYSSLLLRLPSNG